MNPNIAVVGCGYWGPNLIRNFYRLPDCHLIACCDLDQNKLAEIHMQYPSLKVTTDYSELLNAPDIEAIVLATPPRSHYPLAKKAFEHEKHVFVEKPLTLDVSEAEELVEIAEHHHRILMVGHTFEYNPAVLKIKELLDSGQIGDLYYIYSTRVNLGQVRQDLNAIWSIAPHDISIIIFLLGNMPLDVAVRGATCLDKNLEDVAFVSLTFPNNIMANIHVSWLDPSKVRKMTLVGSKKMVIYDDIDSEAKVKVYDKGVYKKGDEVYGEFQYRLHSGDIYIPRIDTTEPLRNECAHFVDCIRQGKKPLSDGESGLRVVKVLEATQRSLQQRGIPVEVE